MKKSQVFFYHFRKGWYSKKTNKQLSARWYRHDGTIIGLLDGDTLELTGSVCSANDTFKKKEGRALAAQRLLECDPLMTVHYKADFWRSPGNCFVTLAERLASIIDANPNILPHITKQKHDAESTVK